jgi:hypothetical protein
LSEGPLYDVGDHVKKTGGDYRFDGIVVAAFYKLSGLRYRYVVEDPRGLLFIFAGGQLELVEKAASFAARKAHAAENVAAAHERTHFPRRPRLADSIDVELPQ